MYNEYTIQCHYLSGTEIQRRYGISMAVYNISILIDFINDHLIYIVSLLRLISKSQQVADTTLFMIGDGRSHAVIIFQDRVSQELTVIIENSNPCSGAF